MTLKHSRNFTKYHDSTWSTLVKASWLIAMANTLTDRQTDREQWRASVYLDSDSDKWLSFNEVLRRSFVHHSKRSSADLTHDLYLFSRHLPLVRDVHCTQQHVHSSGVYTAHSTPTRQGRTLHTATCTPARCTLHTAHPLVRGVHCTQQHVHSSGVYTAHSNMYTSTVYTAHSTMYTRQGRTLHTATCTPGRCTLHTASRARQAATTQSHAISAFHYAHSITWVATSESDAHRPQVVAGYSQDTAANIVTLHITTSLHSRIRRTLHSYNKHCISIKLS